VTTAAPVRTSVSRRPELLLFATLPAFVVYVAVAVATVATETDSTSAELTPAALSDLGPSWMALHVLWMAPSVLAALGLALLAARAGLRTTPQVRRLREGAIALAVLYLVPQGMAYTLDAQTWGDSPWYAVGVALSLGVAWLGTIPATLLVTTGLARRGIVPRTARTIAALCGLYLVWEVLTYASIAFGPATLTDTVGPPPFLLGLLWAALGARLWWAGRQDGA